MQYATQEETARGWTTMGLHPTATAAESQRMAGCALDARAQGQIAEVPGSESVQSRIKDTRPGPRGVEMLGYER